MRRHRRFQAVCESLEGKTLLSALPVLSQSTFNQVLHQIDRAAGTFAKTHNAIAFDAALAQISSRIPYGHSQLYPTWQSDEAIYDPTVPGSGGQMVQQLKTDLKGYAQTAVADGAVSVRGRWLGVSDPPAIGTVVTITPVLSNKTYQSAFAQIDHAAGTFAKTHNATAFDAALARISRTLPYGFQQLYPTWQSDEGIYDPTVQGSGVQMVKQFKADLVSFVQGGVAARTFTVR
jgi:hypothetical protein